MSIIALSWITTFLGLSLLAPYIYVFGPESPFLSNVGILSLYIFIGLPILGIILFLARLGFKYQINKRYSFYLWVVWFLAMFLFSYVSMVSVVENKVEASSETITTHSITQKTINVIKQENEKSDINYLKWESPFFIMQENILVENIDIKIETSSDSLIHIKQSHSSRGLNNLKAKQKLEHIDHFVHVNDNNITIGKSIKFPAKDKFRNQKVTYTIYVPEGVEVNIKDKFLSPKWNFNLRF